MKRAIITAIFLIVVSVVGNSAFANDLERILRGLTGSNDVNQTRAKWDKLSEAEFLCFQKGLQRNGIKFKSIIKKGILPSDPSLAEIRSFCSSAATQSFGGPSFNCKAASLADEKMICSDPGLSELDRLIASGYNYLSNQRGRDFAGQLGLEFWKKRASCLSNYECIKASQIDVIRVFQNNGAPIQLPFWVSREQESGGNVAGSAGAAKEPSGQQRER